MKYIKQYEDVDETITITEDSVQDINKLQNKIIGKICTFIIETEDGRIIRIKDKITRLNFGLGYAVDVEVVGTNNYWTLKRNSPIIIHHLESDANKYNL